MASINNNLGNFRIPGNNPPPPPNRNETTKKIIRMSVSSECTICLAAFKPEEDRALPHPPQLQNGRLVTHEFHDECLDDWLQNCRQSGTSPFCPLCRSASPDPQQNLSSSQPLGAAPNPPNRIQQLPPSAPSLAPPQRQPAPYRIHQIPPLDPVHSPQRESSFDILLSNLYHFPMLPFTLPQLLPLHQSMRAPLANPRLSSMELSGVVSVSSPSTSGTVSAIARQYIFRSINQHPHPTSPHETDVSNASSSSSSNVVIPQSSSSSSSSEVGMRNAPPLQIDESGESESPADKYYSSAIRLLNEGDRAGAINQFKLAAKANGSYDYKKHNPNVARFTIHYELARYFRDDLQDFHKAQLHFSKCIQSRVGCRNPDQLAEARIFMAERYSVGSGRVMKNINKALNFLHQILSDPFGVRGDLIQTAKDRFKLYASGIDYSPEAYRQVTQPKKRNASEASLSDNNHSKRPRKG